MSGLGRKCEAAVLLGFEFEFEALVPFLCDDADGAADGRVVNVAVAVAVGADSDEARRRVGRRRKERSGMRDFILFSFADLEWSGM
jgi:hypothetical protein